MLKLRPGLALPLHGVEPSRALEQLAQRGLPPHTLMQRAGLAVARLAMAMAPHARSIWVACGPGNNGGDGLEAALHLQQWGRRVTVTWLGEASHAPADALASFSRAEAAGVTFADRAPVDLTAQDLCIDALLGLGSKRPSAGRLAACIAQMQASQAPVLAVDLPSGLNADTGHFATDSIANEEYQIRAEGTFHAQYTLNLLTLKPGVLTGHGRDAAGEIWFDDLGIASAAVAPDARLIPAPVASHRAHASHKGSYGDVAVIGGAPGMTGAALLAARAALHGGAGRVFVGLLSGASPGLNAGQPELMFRNPSSLDVANMAVVCGCGGGDAVRAVLPRMLASPLPVVLDADALNALAVDTPLQTLLTRRGARGHASVLTPHPLEAARLLGSTVQEVQAHRLRAAQQLADRFGCTLVLKGSGTVVAAPTQTPLINPTGNAKLATAGSGDVLAGLMGALLAALGPDANATQVFHQAAAAVYRHGQVADAWPAGRTLSASELAVAVGHIG